MVFRPQDFVYYIGADGSLRERPLTMPELQARHEREKYDLLVNALAFHHGNKSHAAAALKIERRALYRLLEKGKRMGWDI